MLNLLDYTTVNKGTKACLCKILPTLIANCSNEQLKIKLAINRFYAFQITPTKFCLFQSIFVKLTKTNSIKAGRNNLFSYHLMTFLPRHLCVENGGQDEHSISVTLLALSILRACVGQHGRFIYVRVHLSFCVWVFIELCVFLAYHPPSLSLCQIYTYEMSIIKVVDGDAGGYRCEVTSKDKCDSCTFEVSVQGRSGDRHLITLLSSSIRRIHHYYVTSFVRQ